MGNNQQQDSKVRAYVRLIRTAEAMHSQVSKGLAAEGLTASQFSTLKVLRLQGALAQRDIARYLLKSGGNVTMVVDNLEREGLVARVRDTEDRRIVFVKLTAEGEELFDRIYPGHLQRIRNAMGSLNDLDCERLINLLDKATAEEASIDCSEAAAS